jgi:hypothetical protein
MDRFFNSEKKTTSNYALVNFFSIIGKTALKSLFVNFITFDKFHKRIKYLLLN